MRPKSEELNAASPSLIVTSAWDGSLDYGLTPVDNALEARFALFLDSESDVAAWAKLTMNSRFALEYISEAGAPRYYYPTSSYG